MFSFVVSNVNDFVTFVTGALVSASKVKFGGREP